MSSEASTEISCRLFLLYTSMFVISFVGVVLCLLLVFLLWKYDLFHKNCRTIFLNILVCILINNLVQMLRPALVLWLYAFEKQSTKVSFYRSMGL